MKAITLEKDREPVAKQRKTRRGLLRRRQRRHDPLLVLSMSRFNFADGWDRTFSTTKIRERGA